LLRYSITPADRSVPYRANMLPHLRRKWLAVHYVDNSNHDMKDITCFKAIPPVDF